MPTCAWSRHPAVDPQTGRLQHASLGHDHWRPTWSAQQLLSTAVCSLFAPQATMAPGQSETARGEVVAGGGAAPAAHTRAAGSPLAESRAEHPAAHGSDGHGPSGEEARAVPDRSCPGHLGGSPALLAACGGALSSLPPDAFTQVGLIFFTHVGRKCPPPLLPLNAFMV
jgi:hypothetical protein